jgi:sarcosine oxidase gamma subunit
MAIFFLEDFAFRKATPFVSVPAGVDLNIIVAPAGAGIANGVGPVTVNLTEGETYIAIANGIVSATGYDPAAAFSLNVFAAGREAATEATNTDVLVFHGSTDAPTVSVWETGVGAGQIISDFTYGDFEGYLELPTADYVLEVRTADGQTTVVAYSAPLSTLELDGAALTVVASGFLNPAANSNGPAFGLFVATPAGGDLIALPVYVAPDPTARIQIIHNSADAAVEEVDIYVNGDLFLSDFAFRTATPFVSVPAGVDLNIIVAPAGADIANGVGPVTVNLTDGETYIAIANGIVSATGYDPAAAFSLDVFPTGREAATVATNTDVLVFHGSTDAPTVSVWETGVGAGQIISDFTYGDFEGYLELPTADYILEVRTADGQTTVVAYSAPLSTLGLDGAALTVVASGFLNPANNSNGEGFGLFVALAAGGDLIALPVYVAPDPTARIQIIHNSADAAVEEVDIYVNGDLFLSDFAFRTATPFVSVPAGVDLNIIVAPAGAGIANGVGPVTVNLADGETYIAIANGIVSATGYDPAAAFSLDVFAAGREAATVATNTDVLVFHGSTDAPTVSVWETGVGAGELFTFSYGDFAGYLALGTADYVLEVRTADGETTVVSYSAPLATLGLDGAALTVVASGFLNPANNSDGAAFGLYVALASGGALIALPVYTETFEVTFNVNMTYAEDFDPANDVVYITGSIFGWAEPGTQPENQTMTRVDDSMIWTKTVNLEAGEYAYKYFLNAGWGGGEWQGGDDRFVTVEGDMVINDWFGYRTDPTSIDDLKPAAQLNLFPNPARQMLNVVSDQEIREIRMFDMLGKVVYAADVKNERYVMNVNGFKNGIYFMQVLTPVGVTTQRVQISN